MYCHACGQVIPAGSLFCSHCGSTQQVAAPRRDTVPSVLVALALIFFPPLGLILMWTSTDWDSDVKWGISGLFFPPLWLRFIWRVWWLPYAIGGLLALAILRDASDGLSTVSAVLLGLIALILFLTFNSQRRTRFKRRTRLEGLRAAIERKLEYCHDLIAEIEGRQALGDTGVRRLQSRYMAALEMRSQGNRLLEHARSRQELLAADHQISRALNEFRAIHDGLPDGS